MPYALLGVWVLGVSYNVVLTSVEKKRMWKTTQRRLSAETLKAVRGFAKTAIQMEDTLEATCLPENRTFKLLS